jgi:hypothetical protein
VRALAADRKALAVPEAAIGSEIHQTLDVHRDFAAQIALDAVIGVDRLTDLENLLVGEILDSTLWRDAEFRGDLFGLGPADAVNIGKRDFHALVRRDIDARNTCHVGLSPAPQAGMATGLSQRFMSPETGIADERKAAPPEDRLSG